MTFTPGEHVTISNARNPELAGEIALVSPNQKSIAVAFDGRSVGIRTSAGGIFIVRAFAFLQDPPDTFTDLAGDPWTIIKR